MSDYPERHPSDMLEAAARIHGRANILKLQPLSVAILGPKLSLPTEGFRNKRSQIFRSLRDAGHDPFYPEARIRPDSHWADEERKLLSSPGVHLVIVLQTSDSTGVFGELVGYSLFPEIRRKTAVLTPQEHFNPDDSFLANSVSYYPIRVVYTERQFEECCLVEDCRQIVEEVVIGDSDLVLPFDR